jgi:hypothetical protein
MFLCSDVSRKRTCGHGLRCLESPKSKLFFLPMMPQALHRQKKSLDFGLSRRLKFCKLPIVVHRQK